MIEKRLDAGKHLLNEGYPIMLWGIASVALFSAVWAAGAELEYFDQDGTDYSMKDVWGRFQTSSWYDHDNPQTVLTNFAFTFLAGWTTREGLNVLFGGKHNHAH